MNGEDPAETLRRIGEAARIEAERHHVLMQRIELATTDQLEDIVRFLDRKVVTLVNKQRA